MTHYVALHKLYYGADATAEPGEHVIDLSDDETAFFLREGAIREPNDEEKALVASVEPIGKLKAVTKRNTVNPDDNI